MIHEIQEGYVKIDHDHGITTIEFFHPQSNSLPGKLLHELAQEIHIAGLDTQTKVIILRSSGDRAFCAGASFEELQLIHTEAEGQKFFGGFAEVINAMRKCPKFIIGRIQGKCVGGGVGLVAAVDYCIAWEKVEIKLSELALGFGPFVIGPAVERKIGSSAFTQLAIDSSLWRNADWAKKKGLFAEVHESLENMDHAVNRLAGTLAHSSPEAMKELKKSFWKGTEHWDDLLQEKAAISGRLVNTEFARQAIAKVRKTKEVTKSTA
jgi:methylglutaconyl-CoA hydratase